MKKSKKQVAFQEEIVKELKVEKNKDIAFESVPEEIVKACT